MQNNYYFLKKLSFAIAQKLDVDFWQLAEEEFQRFSNENPMELLECFSQEKDELILGFANSQEDFYIKAVIPANFATLAFPEDFHRAKKNSIDLFSQLIGKKVLFVSQYWNERAFSLHFEEDFQLLFKMHGRRSNIILFEKEQFVIAFHKKLENDQNIELATLDRAIDQSYEAFFAAEGEVKKLFPTFGKDALIFLSQLGLDAENSAEKNWEIVQNFLKELETDKFYLQNPETKPQLLLMPAKNTLEIEVESSLQAANEFYYAYTRLVSLEDEKKEVLKILRRKKKQAQTYIQKNFNRLESLEEGIGNEKTADILMANLHQIPEGASEVELFDFYQNKNRVFKLKKELSAQKNAENLYRKAKNEKIEIEKIQENIEYKETELKKIETQIAQIESVESLKELRKYLKQEKLVTPKKKDKNQPADLFKKFKVDDFDIWVGKNAKNNDVLTQQYAHKDDLWLHAKDVSGSHVVIKHQSGKLFPKKVIEKAASLAAYYSKRSSDTLCPVIVTPKKFVRKTKDLAPGQVLVEKEEVIMVIPEKG